MTQRVFIFILICISSVLLITSIGVAQQFSNANFGFSVELPDGWDLVEKPENSSIHALVPKDKMLGSARQNIIITSKEVPSVLTAEGHLKEGFVGKTWENLKSFPDYELGSAFMDGVEAKWVKFTITRKDKVNITMISAACVKNGRGYGIVFVAENSFFQQERAVYDRAVQSFKIIEMM